MTRQVLKKLIALQKCEITDHHICGKLAQMMTPGDDRKILERIAGDEKCHSRVGFSKWRA